MLMTFLLVGLTPSAAQASAEDCNPEIGVEKTCAWIDGTGTYVDSMKASFGLGAGKVVYGYFRFTTSGNTIAATTAKYYETSWCCAKNFDSGWQVINKRFADNTEACAMFRYRKSGVWYTWPSRVCFTIHA